MKNALSFDETLVSSLNSKVTVSKWKDCKDLYDQKKYKEAILTFFDYLDLKIRKKYSDATETHFKIPHGSIVIEITITDTHLHIKAPFLKVGDNQKIPLYRKIAEANFSPLILSQIKLNNAQLNFEYSSPLALCEPLKIYDVLKETCHCADNYDDDFISMFDVEPLQEPNIKMYNQEILETVWAKWNSYLAEADQYMAHFDQVRASVFNWDIISLTLKRIDYLIAPQGKLRTDIERQIFDLNSKANFQDKIQRGKRFLEMLKSKNKEAVLADFYISESLIPIKSRSDLTHAKQYLKVPFENAKKEIDKKQYVAASLTLLLAYYNYFYTSRIPEDINVKMVNTLKSAASKDWQSAALALYNGMDAIINDTVTQPETSKTITQ